MQVQVEKKCGRCPKKESVSISLEEAQELQEASKDAEKVHQGLCDELEEALDKCPCPPDVMVAYKTSDGFKVRALADLCATGKSGGCLSRVTNLIKEVFLEGPKKTPKKKASTRPDEPAAPATPSTEGGGD